LILVAFDSGSYGHLRLVPSHGGPNRTRKIQQMMAAWNTKVEPGRGQALPDMKQTLSVASGVMRLLEPVVIDAET
jgi:hypothetical protein